MPLLLRLALLAVLLTGCTRPTDLGGYGDHVYTCPDGGMITGASSAANARCLRTDWIASGVTIAWALWLWSRINATHASARRIEEHVERIRDDLRKRDE